MTCHGCHYRYVEQRSKVGLRTALHFLPSLNLRRHPGILAENIQDPLTLELYRQEILDQVQDDMFFFKTLCRCWCAAESVCHSAFNSPL